MWAHDRIDGYVLIQKSTDKNHMSNNNYYSNELINNNNNNQ